MSNLNSRPKRTTPKFVWSKFPNTKPSSMRNGRSSTTRWRLCTRLVLKLFLVNYPSEIWQHSTLLIETYFAPVESRRTIWNECAKRQAQAYSQPAQTYNRFTWVRADDLRSDRS